MLRIFTLFQIIALLIFSGIAAGQTYTKFSSSSSVVSLTPPNATRYQLIYSPSDFNSPPPTCVIDQISLRRNGGTGFATIYNLTIKLGCTDSLSFSGNKFFPNLTTVLESSSYDISEGGVSSIVDFDIEDKFTYQAGKLLVMEISFSSATASLNMVYNIAGKRLNGSLASETGTAVNTWLDFGFTPVFDSPAIPANDLCSNAQTLFLNTDCQPTTGNSVGAIQSLPPSFCGGFPSTSANDVYYRFTASTPGDSILVKGTGGFDPVVQLLSGSCGSLTPLVCSYTPGNAQPEKISPGNLVPGQTYFVRVYGFNGIGGGFTICGRTGLPTPPANDNCANAILLPLSTVCAPQAGTTAGASQELAPISCFGNTSTSAHEVWYKFEAAGPDDSVVVRSSGFLNPVLELYSGGCGNLTTISCSDHPTNPLAKERVAPGSLVIGSTYYLRVYGYGSTNGAFTICGQTPPPFAVGNDEACDAYTLTLNDDCVPQNFSNSGATQSLPPVNCQPGGQSSAAADVWFKFNFSSIYDTVVVSPIGNFNPVVEAFSSFVSCLGINSETCSDGIDPSATEKIPTYGIGGNTIYLRVYGYNGTSGSFNICLKKGDPSVLYDECSNALLLDVSSTACSTKVGRTRNATPSTGLTSCKGNPDDDVWYRFDPFGAANLTFRLTCDPGFDGAMQIYSGSCGSFTQLACINRVGAGLQEDTLLSFINSNEMYYIRIYHAGTGAGTGGFSLCVARNTAPTNDNCTGATSLESGTDLCAPFLASNYGAIQANAPTTCGGRTSSVANDVWFRFTATAANMEINIRPVGGMDPVIQLYSGNCFNQTDRACKDDSLAAQGERLIATNLSVGISYYFRVYSFAQPTAYGDFYVCVKNANLCNTTAGTALGNITSSATNGRIVLNLSGQTMGANVQWQISTNGGTSYSNLGSANAILPDTFQLTSTSSIQNQLFRAVVTSGTCLSSTTAPVQVSVRCATPFLNPISASSGTSISLFGLHTLTNTSSPEWKNGGYENFTSLPLTLCKGQSYPLKINHLPEGSIRTRTVWADFNNDGDFDDAGELLLPPNTGSGPLNETIVIPANSSASQVRLRVLVADVGSGNPSILACAAGPYLAGEIEEYSLNLSSPVVANAGTDKVTCSATALLQGSAPTPGTGIWSVVSGPATIQSPGSSSTIVQNIGPVPSLLEWRITNGACVSADTISVVRETNPIDLVEDSTACQGDTIRLPSPTNFPGFLWSNGSAGLFFQILNSGTYWLQVTTVNGCTFRDTILVTMEPCTGLENKITNEGLTIAPNPVSSYLNIEGIENMGILQIFNSEGKLVETSLHTRKLEVEHFPPGIYSIYFPNLGKNIRFVKE